MGHSGYQAGLVHPCDTSDMGELRDSRWTYGDPDAPFFGPTSQTDIDTLALFTPYRTLNAPLIAGLLGKNYLSYRKEIKERLVNYPARCLDFYNNKDGTQ